MVVGLSAASSPPSIPSLSSLPLPSSAALYGYYAGSCLYSFIPASFPPFSPSSSSSFPLLLLPFSSSSAAAAAVPRSLINLSYFTSSRLYFFISILFTLFSPPSPLLLPPSHSSFLFLSRRRCRLFLNHILYSWLPHFHLILFLFLRYYSSLVILFPLFLLFLSFFLHFLLLSFSFLFLPLYH